MSQIDADDFPDLSEASSTIRPSNSTDQAAVDNRRKRIAARVNYLIRLLIFCDVCRQVHYLNQNILDGSDGYLYLASNSSPSPLVHGQIDASDDEPQDASSLGPFDEEEQEEPIQYTDLYSSPDPREFADLLQETTVEDVSGLEFDFAEVHLAYNLTQYSPSPDVDTDVVDNTDNNNDDTPELVLVFDTSRDINIGPGPREFVVDELDSRTAAGVRKLHCPAWFLEKCHLFVVYYLLPSTLKCANTSVFQIYFPRCNECSFCSCCRYAFSSKCAFCKPKLPSHCRYDESLPLWHHD